MSFDCRMTLIQTCEELTMRVDEADERHRRVADALSDLDYVVELGLRRRIEDTVVRKGIEPRFNIEHRRIVAFRSGTFSD